MEARRSDSVVDPGYEWLAFSWDNFRYSAQRSNRFSKNEETDENEGKGNWFPLLDGSPKACWENRCEGTEKPLLLDPVDHGDVQLIDVLDDGRMGPSATCFGTGFTRVEQSIKLYGLNLPALQAARRRLMREIVEMHTVLFQMIATGGSVAAGIADGMPIRRQIDMIKAKTFPASPYSKAARAQLMKLPNGPALCAQPEDVPS